MKLSDTDLQQLEPTWALSLTPVRKDKLLVTLIEDVKEARERLAANSQNSSRPPRTNAPWTSVPTTADQAAASKTPSDAVAGKPAADTKSAPEDAQTAETSTQEGKTSAPPAQAHAKRNAGHQQGAPGHGRALTLAVSATCTHMVSHCAVCQDALDAQRFRPLGGHYVLDVTISANQGLAGLSVTHEKNIYGEICCSGCGHRNRSEPGKVVQFRCTIDGESAGFEIQDEGVGFDPEGVPDPTAEENLEIPSGRGLMLMRAYMSEVVHVAPGNTLRMVYKNGPDPTDT